MLHYRANNNILGGVAQAVAAAQTNQVISEQFPFVADAAYAGLRIAVEMTYVHSANSTLKLQHGIGKTDGTIDWADVGTRAQLTLSASQASATVNELLLHPGVALDAAQLPLRPHLRVVLTTGAGSSAVINSVGVLEPEYFRSSASVTRSQ